MNLGPPVNSSRCEHDPSISADGLTLFFGSNDRPGQLGGEDLWQAPIIPIVDFNGDGFIDIEDLLIMIDNWGTDDSTCDIGPMPWGDGMVNEVDLEVLMSYWKQEIDDPTLIAHWKLDESEGVIAQDSAGDYDGTLNGNPLWQPEGGMFDGAIELDGIDDYISTPFVLSPGRVDAFSVFAWIQGGTQGQVIISQENGEDWLLADDSEGNLSTELKRPVQAAVPLVSQTVITDGEWHRVGFVWDGSYRTLYVDDVEVAKDQDDQVNLKSYAGGLYIGAGKSRAAGSFWSGLIDDVRIHNRAVTP